MLRRTVVVPILTNEILEVKFGNTLGQIENFSKRIELVKGASITKAELRVEASQTYLSGAELQITMNKTRLNPPLRWDAFQNWTKKQNYDITNVIVLGINDFSGIYKTAFGVLNDNKMNLSMDIYLDLLVPDATTPGVDTGPTESEDTLRNIWQKVKEASNVVIGAAVVVAVVVGGVYVVKQRTKFM